MNEQHTAISISSNLFLWVRRILDWSPYFVVLFYSFILASSIGNEAYLKRTPLGMEGSCESVTPTVTDVPSTLDKDELATFLDKRTYNEEGYLTSVTYS